jgi:Acetyltransferase (GNAT) domain
LTAGLVTRPKDAPSATGVTLARTREQAELLRPTWESNSWPNIDADPAFYWAVFEAREEAQYPHVIVIERDGGPSAMVVARVDDARLELDLGYRTVLRPRARRLTVVPGGVMGASTAEAAQMVTSELMLALRRGEADVVLLPSVPTDSPLYVAARAAPSALCRQRMIPTMLRWRVNLPESTGELWARFSSHTRRNLRNSSNRLRRDFADRLAIQVYSEPKDVDRIFRDLEHVSGKTYQRGLGIAFVETTERRRLVELALSKGWFRAWVLEIDGAPAGFWYGYVYASVLFTGTPGYDPKYAQYRIGTYLLTQVLEGLCADDLIDVVDFGAMDAEYKRRFADESWEEADVFMYAPTVRGVALNAITTAISGANVLAKRVLIDTGLFARVRRAWRRRLARPERS